MRGDIVSILESVISGGDEGAPVSGPKAFTPDERDDNHDLIEIREFPLSDAATPSQEVEAGPDSISGIMDEMLSATPAEDAFSIFDDTGPSVLDPGADTFTDVGSIMQGAMDAGSAHAPEPGPQAIVGGNQSWLEPDVPPLDRMADDPVALRSALKKLLRG